MGPSATTTNSRTTPHFQAPRDPFPASSATLTAWRARGRGHLAPSSSCRCSSLVKVLDSSGNWSQKKETLSSKEHLNSSVNHNLFPLPTPNLTIEQIKINNSRACLYDHSKWFFVYSLLKFHYFAKNWSLGVTQHS